LTAAFESVHFRVGDSRESPRLTTVRMGYVRYDDDDVTGLPYVETESAGVKEHVRPLHERTSTGDNAIVITTGD